MRKREREREMDKRKWYGQFRLDKCYSSDRPLIVQWGTPKYPIKIETAKW
jgi:hypothetical protein